MSEIVLRLVWFFVASCAVAYMVFLIAGHMIRTEAAEIGNTVLVRDALQPGVHHLSGMIFVPSTCSELTVKSEKIGDTLYELRFSTWETPVVKCAKEEVPRAFSAIVFAPSTGIHFVASLDGVTLPIVVLPYIK